MHSAVWNSFDRSEGGISARCRGCGTEIRMLNGSTSNLHRHLRSCMEFDSGTEAEDDDDVEGKKSSNDQSDDDTEVSADQGSDSETIVASDDDDVSEKDESNITNARVVNYDDSVYHKFSKRHPTNIAPTSSSEFYKYYMQQSGGGTIVDVPNVTTSDQGHQIGNSKPKVVKQTLKYLCACGDPTIRKVVLRRAPDDVVRVVCDAVRKADRGDIPLPQNERKLLDRNDNSVVVAKLTAKNVPLHTKRRVLVQKGGFLLGVLPKILGPVIRTLGSLFSNDAEEQ